MKHLLLAAAMFTAVAVQAQSDKYVDAMKKNLEAFHTDSTTQHWETLSAAFARIGDAEKTQWLPYYWAGLSLAEIGWKDEKTDKDALAARILAFVDKADALATDNGDKSEIYTLKNMAYTQKMLVNPQERWMTDGKSSGEALEKATQLNHNNPRVYYLQGMGIFNTPEQYGGGKDKAKPVLQKAVALYANQQPKPLYPDWGKEQATQALAACQ